MDRGRRPSGREGLVELLSAWERSGRALTEGAIRAGLQGLRLDRDSLAECVNFHERSYQRNRIYRTPGYELLVLCWRSGQRSPIHDHGRSTCGVLILEGVATETSFAASPCGRLVPSRSRRIESRSVVVSRGGDVHQLANLEAPGVDLISLHVYSPPLAGTRFYRIDDTSLIGHDQLADATPGTIVAPLRAGRSRAKGFPDGSGRRLFRC